MSNCSSNPQLTPINITAGSDIVFSVRLIRSDTKDPYDLTQIVSCDTLFKNADGTFLTVGLTSGAAVASPAAIGKITFTIPATSTALLNGGVNSFQMTLIVGSIPITSIVQFAQAINVLGSVFS